MKLVLPPHGYMNRRPTKHHCFSSAFIAIFWESIINLFLLIWALKRIIGFWLVLFCNVSKFKHASNRRHRGGSPIEFESKQVSYVVIWSSRFFQSVPRKVECNPFDVFGIIELAPFIATVNHIVSSHKQCKQIYIMEDIKPTLNPVKRECQSYFTTTKRW